MSKPKPKPAATPFAGFARDAMQFWHELAAEMNRDWFLANKERYERTWVQPLTALLEAASARLASAYRGHKLGAPKVMRIQRDIRFSKDNSPYKTWIGAGVSVGDRKPSEGVTALYLHFGVGAEFVGAGQYVFADATLAKWRRLVAGPKGAEIAKIVDAMKRAKYSIAAYETLTRVPHGLDPDHPRAELLRRKGSSSASPPSPRG